jgi:dTDP-4-amino-4,6-dideoxygalactose transaminase
VLRVDPAIGGSAQTRVYTRCVYESPTRPEPLVNVPFLDLAPVHVALKARFLEELSVLIDTNDFINGPPVREFERAFAEYCHARECVGTSSGLDALRLALLATGLEERDEVLVPATTFIATLEAVTQAGGVPVLVDVLEEDYNIDPGAVDAAITSRSRCLIPVHLYGQMANMRALARIAERHSLPMIEDACQAHGAVRDELRPGAAGIAAAFSFYPAKNLGGMGDGGALVTNDEELASRVRALREHGQTEKYRHDVEGYTARLDSIQALVLLLKLPLLDRWNDERRAVARLYTDALDGIGDLRLPPTLSGSDPVWHVYLVRTADPQALAALLRDRGIGTARHYPEPPHLSRAFAWLGHTRGEFPVTERIADECLSLPIFPGMSESQVSMVVESIIRFFRNG